MRREPERPQAALRSGYSTLVPLKKTAYVYPTTYTSKIFSRIGSDVIAIHWDSSHQTAPRGSA
jgi:hypothetical protein